MPRRTIPIILLLLVFLIWGAGSRNPHNTIRPLAPETQITRIPLTGPLAHANAEISGLAWYGETLILLPQYPERMTASSGGALFALPKTEILAYLNGEISGPLTPHEIPFDPSELRERIPGYEGFEAAAFYGETAFFTIEASPGRSMKSYLARGTIEPDLSRLTLDVDAVVEIPLDVQIPNFSNEAVLIAGQQVIVFFEANGADVNPQSRAYRFDFDLNPSGYYTLPPLEYRLTDASTADASGRFWVTNYFFPADIILSPRRDPLIENYGQGLSHSVSSVVERLVELQLPPDGSEVITFTGTPPIQIQLAPGRTPRNWEGIARLDERGILLATDKFPQTILAFVPFQK
jgi:hypothetical protein